MKVICELAQDRFSKSVGFGGRLDGEVILREEIKNLALFQVRIGHIPSRGRAGKRESSARADWEGTLGGCQARGSQCHLGLS